MAVRVMSDKELARFEVLGDLTTSRLTVSADAELLGLERRLVQIEPSEFAQAAIGQRVDVVDFPERRSLRTSALWPPRPDPPEQGI